MEYEDVKLLVDQGYKTKSAEPLKCHDCNSVDLRDTTSHEEGYVVHIERSCVKCGATCGEWDYGNWSW